MRGAGVVLACLALAACDLAQGPAEAVARQQAKNVINGVVSTNFPGVNARPVTNCIVDNATLDEVLAIARAAVVGVDAQTTQTILDVASRPETVTCIAANGLDLLG